MSRDSIPQIASAIMGVIFLIYFVSYLSTELGRNAFISPGLFIVILILLLIVFIIEVIRKFIELF